MESWSERFDSSGWAAIVTGAAMEIGERVARRLGGQRAGGADVDRPKAESIAAEWSRSGARSSSVEVDVREATQLGELASKTTEKLELVDILADNAGVFPFSPFLEVTPELWIGASGGWASP